LAPPAILLAGSEKQPLNDLADILGQGGYEVRVCPRAQVLEEARVQAPDLLLLAGDLEGDPSLLGRLRGGPETREIPIILALPGFSEAAAARALESGADEFIFPPFQAREVLARVAVVLRLREDRRLLLASQEEFARAFQETAQPLVLCDRQGAACRLNPALRRFLGYPRRADQFLASQVLYSAEDQERFRQLLARPGAGRVKVYLRSRDGKPVTVLLSDLGRGSAPEGRVSLRVQPVGAPSPLKEALRGLVEHFLPAAWDYLALLQLTPLLGDRYEKVKKLGQGSFGEIWLVLDTEVLGPPRRYYVAKIPFTKATNPYFRKEAAVCGKLAPHPGAVTLVDTVEEDGKFIIIQEYVEGRTLADLLGEELPPALVESVILQLIDVVAQAHGQRIIHRDIKPNNIIVRPDGRLKLLDYGAAKILKEKEIGATMVGSRPFMAPEQILGKSERRSDIWAIGVLMYLLYTGELPFYSDVEKLLIDQILEQEPQPPRSRNPEIPPALEAIILKCLKKNVEERYPKAQALKADLLRHFPRFGGGGKPWTR
jgi:CheY-like chemotaxis protein/predicted Ser/Thr protein kinase